MINNKYEINKDKFDLYTKELLKWSAIHNLTTYKTKTIIDENIKYSIFPINFIKNFNIALDIGTGNGLPAIPLAIIKNDSKFIFIEPNIKKVSFLLNISLELKLDNVEIIKDKIENIKLKDIDLITSRALFNTNKLIELTNNMLKSEGHFLFYKGSNEKIKFNENNYIKHNKMIYFYKQKLC